MDAYDQFISSNNAWIHEGIQIIDDIFGVQDVKLNSNDDKLQVTLILDPKE